MFYTNKTNSQIPTRTLNPKYLIILVVSFLSISVLMSIELVYADPTISSFFGTNGKGNGWVDTTYNITTDSNENIYVSDTVNNRIQKFSSNSNFISVTGTTGEKETL
jgi:hypothetical protein